MVQAWKSTIKQAQWPASVIVCGSFSCFHGFFCFLLFSWSQETLELETWIPLAFVLLAITFITYLLDCV
jgi:hypothetical protein